MQNNLTRCFSDIRTCINHSRCNCQDHSEAGGDSTGRRKEQEVVQKDVTRLCAAIQALTSNIVPVIKVLDYFPEDVDAMQKELEMWHNETQTNTATLETEERSDSCICLTLTCLASFWLTTFPNPSNRLK